MRKVGISVLLFLSAVAYGQTINPNQIRPATTNGYVLTTVGGATVWAPGTGITFQTNSANNASQSLLNLEAGTNMTITNTSGGNVLFSSVNGTTLPPPFPVPNGQAVAWAYPTASTCGPTVASTNGFAACGPQAGIVAKYFSSPLGNCCWAATWNGFVMPTLPSDAVIQGVYGVEFVQHLFDQGTATGITQASCNGGTMQVLNNPADGINYTGEYYTVTSLGSTASNVTSASCNLNIDSSLGPATLFNVNYINQVAIAIYYTTATPPPLEPYAPVVTNIQLQVGGVANGNQGLLNIAATSPITVADNGTGTVTIACPSCGGTSAVAQVTNSDGTLTISPTTGNVIASLALGHANTWTAAQTISTSGFGTSSTLFLNNASNAASTGIPVMLATCPNLVSTSACYLAIGQADTTGNSGSLNFHYVGNNSAANAFFVSFFANPAIQQWFNSGDTEFGNTTPTDPGVLLGVGTTNQLKVSSAGNLITSGGIDNSVIGATTKAAGSFTTLLASTSITDSGLTSGNCVQASTGGLLTTTGSPCGSGGSGPTLQTNTVNNTLQTTLNLINSSTNAAGLSLTETNTSGGIVQGEVAGILNAGHGGSGVANTATHTLGTSNQNWATLGTGIVKNTTTTGAITDATSGDVIGLWTGTCSSSTFLRGDGACAAASGSSGISGLTAGFIPIAGSSTTLTANSHIDDGVTTAATLTASEPLAVTGAPGIIMAHATATPGVVGSVVYTVDATTGFGEMNQNNLGLERIAGWNTANTFTANQTAPSFIASGSGAGSVVLTNGTAPSAVASSVQLIPPATVTTAYNYIFPAGPLNSANPVLEQCTGTATTLSCAPASGTVSTALVTGTYSDVSFNNSHVATAHIGLEADSSGTDKNLYEDVPTGGVFNFRVNSVSGIEAGVASGNYWAIEWGAAPTAAHPSIQADVSGTDPAFYLVAGTGGQVQMKSASLPLATFVPGSAPTGACSGNYFTFSATDGKGTYCNGTTQVNKF